MADMSDDEIKRALEAVRDGDREMGEGPVMHELYRRGLITPEGLEVSEGWSHEGSRDDLLTPEGRDFLHGSG